MNSLSTVQKFANVFKILSTIVMVCCFVSTVLCAAAGAALVAGSDLFTKLLIDYPEELAKIYQEANVSSFSQIGVVIITCGIASFAVGMQFVFAVKYFKNELTAGTPFTFAGAKELRTLGILIMAIPFAVSIICSIFTNGCGLDTKNLEIDIPIIFGVVLIALSFVFKYGAELIESKNTDIPESKVPDEITAE